MKGVAEQKGEGDRVGVRVRDMTDGCAFSKLLAGRAEWPFLCGAEQRAEVAFDIIWWRRHQVASGLRFLGIKQILLEDDTIDATSSFTQYSRLFRSLTRVYQAARGGARACIYLLVHPTSSLHIPATSSLDIRVREQASQPLDVDTNTSAVFLTPATQNYLSNPLE